MQGIITNIQIIILTISFIESGNCFCDIRHIVHELIFSPDPHKYCINIRFCVVCKVCESSGATEDLDLQSLATHVAETLVFHIQQRVAEKPAGTPRLLLSSELALINFV